MTVTAIKQFLFPAEFVIDEQPEAVFREVKTLSAEASAEDQAPVKTEEEADLLTEVSRLMVEQVRLEQKAKMLESGKTGDDEFARFVRQALPFLDNFWRLLEMAREQPPSEELKNWLSSVESLYYRIVRLLENYGLVFMNSMGQEVNLDYHEVVEYRQTRDFPHNKIIKELEKGAVFRNRLLRDAKVVVACNP